MLINPAAAKAGNCCTRAFNLDRHDQTLCLGEAVAAQLDLRPSFVLSATTN